MDQEDRGKKSRFLKMFGCDRFLPKWLPGLYQCLIQQLFAVPVLRQRLLDLDQFYNYNSYLNSTSFLGNDRAGSCQFNLQLTLEIQPVSPTLAA
jgi:hypothetical protein